MKPPRPGTKTAAVLAALRRRRGLTSMEAFAELSETSLASTVLRLRRSGYVIVGKWCKCQTRYNNTTARFIRYAIQSKGTTT